MNPLPDFLIAPAAAHQPAVKPAPLQPSHQIVVTSTIVGEPVPPAILEQPEKIHAYYEAHIRPTMQQEKEHVHVLMLDARLQIKAWNLVSMGGLVEAQAHAREVFRPAIAAAAHAIILIHNHPSGDPSPSAADLRVTQRMKDAGLLLQIQLMDHLIAGESRPGRLPYYSFREAGLV